MLAKRQSIEPKETRTLAAQRYRDKHLNPQDKNQLTKSIQLDDLLDNKSKEHSNISQGESLSE